MSKEEVCLEHKGWKGVDLDGTLAVYDGWKGPLHIGPPIPSMVKRVRAWVAEGWEVKIVTARVRPWAYGAGDLEIRTAITVWCLKHIGVVLAVTNGKDKDMVELWDDRVVQVEKNTGRILSLNPPAEYKWGEEEAGK